MSTDDRTGDAADAFLRNQAGRQVDDDGVISGASESGQRRRDMALSVDPDAPIPLPIYKQIERAGGNGIPDYLERHESERLKDIGDGLIERIEGYAKLAEFRIGYLWATSLGSANGEAKLWKLEKPTALVAWALGSPVKPRGFDLFLSLNSEVAMRAQVTHWQAQAMIHTALECVKVRNGRISIEPAGTRVQTFITARYGPWNDSLIAIGKALAIAEQGRLPLWGDDE